MSEHRDSERRHAHKNGVRAAITWLHNRAKGMNDPNATAILNSAAFNLGRALSDNRILPPGSDSSPAAPAHTTDTLERARETVRSICPNDFGAGPCDWPECRESKCTFWPAGDKIASGFISAVEQERQAIDKEIAVAIKNRFDGLRQVGEVVEAHDLIESVREHLAYERSRLSAEPPDTEGGE